jgi:O-antigen ligase
VLDLISEKPLLGWGYGAMWLNNDISTAPFINTLGWNPLSAHNEFLEVALELGLVGVAVILIIILVTLRRGVYCILIGRNQIGMFLLLFVFASMATGIVESTLVENQTIDWVLFNILSFSAGLEITRQKALREKSATPDGRSILLGTKPVLESSS